MGIQKKEILLLNYNQVDLRIHIYDLVGVTSVDHVSPPLKGTVSTKKH